MANPRKSKILIVDDHEASRYTAGLMLRQAGFDKLEAATGAEALALAQEHRPDLILLDVNLPDISGLEVCRRIKHDAGLGAIPVLMMSASFTKTADQVRGLDGGADGYLTEPLEPAVVIATVRALLRIRQAEEAVIAAARHWEVTFDAVSESVCLLDQQGKVVRCNQATCVLIGKTEKEIVGQDLAEVLTTAPAVSWDSPLRQALVGRKKESLELASGAQWFQISANPITDGTDDSIQMVCIISDITQRKRVEQERLDLLNSEQSARLKAEEMSAEANAANRMKDEFLAVVSHELRTPLNSILGWTHLLKSRRLDEAATQSAIETIERNARAQAQLINDLLDVSRIISGRLRLNVRQVDLRSLINSALETVRPAAEAKGIELELQIEPLPVYVSGDPDRLQRVVWNLVSNAIKFTPAAGKVKVSLRSLKSQAEVVVSDNGQGIKPELLPHIFERFRQGDSSTTRTHGGLGLGLAIVRHLVEMHGGTVEATSAGISQGAMFSIRLPLVN